MMSTEQRYIVIPRWDDFQHRDMARSTVPPWIKTYTKLMGDDDFLELSFHLRGLLISLWLEYAAARRQLGGSTVALSRRLGQRVTIRDLTSLNHAGFIEFSASRPASDYASGLASLEVEVEVEGFKKTPRSETKSVEFIIRTMISNGAIPDLVTLDAELRARDLNGDLATELRALIEEPTPVEPPRAVDLAETWIRSDGFMHEDPLAEALTRFPGLRPPDTTHLETVIAELAATAPIETT